MSRYNHFGKSKYADKVCFGSLSVGEKFRMDKFKDGKRREGIVMIKTSALSYQEFKSKKECRVMHSGFEVSCY